MSINKIGKILNQIYLIENKKTRIGTVVEHLFYRDIVPTGGADKQIRVYTIKSRIELLDIKKELGIKESDQSLDLVIHKRKNNILDKLNDIENEILLEGLF